MNCIFKNIGPSEKRAGWFKYKCQREGCELVGHSPHPAVINEQGIEVVVGPKCLAGASTYIAPPSHGPGTELHRMIKALGIIPTAGCGCAQRMSQMDRWGVAGCTEHRAEIISWIRESYDAADVLTKLRAAGNAMAQGLPLTIEGLVDEAILRSQSTSSSA